MCEWVIILLLFLCAQVCTYLKICIYVRIDICKYICKYVCTYTCMWVCLRAHWVFDCSWKHDHFWEHVRSIILYSLHGDFSSPTISSYYTSPLYLKPFYFTTPHFTPSFRTACIPVSQCQVIPPFPHRTSCRLCDAHHTDAHTDSDTISNTGPTVSIRWISAAGNSCHLSCYYATIYHSIIDSFFAIKLTRISPFPAYRVQLN